MGTRITDGKIEHFDSATDSSIITNPDGSKSLRDRGASHGVVHTEKTFKRREESERATQVAITLYEYLIGKANTLCRPVRLEDLAEQERQAFGYALAHKGKLTWPPSIEELRRVAATYLKAQGRVGQRFTA